MNARDIAQRYLSGEDGWKDFVLDLPYADDLDACGLTVQHYDGIYYANNVVFTTMCRTCNDQHLFEWVDAFAQALVDGTVLPLPPIGCVTGRCGRQSVLG